MKQPCETNCVKMGPYCRTSCDKWKAYESERNLEYEERLRRYEVILCMQDGVGRVQRSHFTRSRKGQ